MASDGEARGSIAFSPPTPARLPKRQEPRFDCGPLPIIREEELQATTGAGGRVGGRALREWHLATVRGTRVVVSRQRLHDNPPEDMRRANVRAYALLRHPNIVALLGITPAGELVTELCEDDLAPAAAFHCQGGGGGGGETNALRQRQHRRRRSVEEKQQQQEEEEEKGDDEGEHEARPVLSLFQSLCYARDIARALAWAHSMGVIHRDVKPAHWLVVGEQVKLGGWMFAEVQEGSIHPKPDNRFHGTPLYMAPELWKQEEFDGKEADVYSFGLSLWEVVNNELAFMGCNDLYSFREALIEKDMRPELSEKIPAAVNRLMASCWAQDPDDRPTMVEVVDSLTKIIDAISLLEGANHD